MSIYKNNIVGLTGGIGSGKTTVTNLFAKKGVAIVDADIVARDVVRPNSVALKSIIQHFGNDILNPDATLNRAKLRSIIFQNKEEKLWLESLLHPIIRQEITDQLTLLSTSNTYVILSSPLLLETDQHTLVDTIASIDVTKETQLDRASHRDNNTVEQIEKIINSQISQDERRIKSDIIINNDHTILALNSQVDEVHLVLSKKYSIK